MYRKSTISGYEAANSEAAYYIHKNSGVFRVAGPDQVLFLQRQTTNDIRLLQPGRAVLTVLTTPNARILDVFYLILEQDPTGVNLGQSPAITLLTLPGKGNDTFRYLMSRIFFMDQVTVSDHSADWILIDVLGPKASQFLQKIGASRLPAPDEVLTFTYQDTLIQTIGLEPSFAQGSRLLIPASIEHDLQMALDNLGFARIDDPIYQVLRVEAGLPASEHVLMDRFTPLEIGLRKAISDSKGCYTGQEVVARQITYDKVTQSLCGLKLEAPALEGGSIETDDRSVGVLTSVVESPRFGWIALGVIKRPFHLPGNILRVGSQNAQVCEIPFG